MKNRKMIVTAMLVAAVLILAAAALLIAGVLSGPRYTLEVTGPTGTVFPMSASAKAYCITEDARIEGFIAKGSSERGDNSYAPVAITWRDSDDSAVTRYVVEYAREKDFSDAIAVESASVNSKKVEVYNLYKASAYYVRVTAYSGNEILGQGEGEFCTTDIGPRFLKIDGLFNVRDLGGYVTADGKTTLQGMIYRGSEMDGGNGMELTPESNAYMRDALGIKVDLDLRGNSDPSPISGAVKKAVGIGGYMGAYEQPEQYRQIFSILADENNYPMYMHCMGGADRTGTVCYLVNALLGVSEQDLNRDYEVTSYSVFGARSRNNPHYDFALFVETLKSYEGDTLAEQTASYMRSIGVTDEEIQNIRAILLGE